MDKLRGLRKNAPVSWLAVTLGTAMCVFALNFFLIPFDIAPGGFSGIATIVFRVSNEKIPVGITMLVLNIPPFITAWRALGRSFALRTLYSLFLYSILADVLPVSALAREEVVSAVYGGVIMGAGLGTVILFGGCTGGTDLVALIINRRAGSMSTGTLLFLIDGLVVAVSAFVFGVSSALLAVLSVYLMGRIVGIVTEGPSAGSVYMIFSKKSELIKERIQKELSRGATELSAKGGYLGESFPALVCAVDFRSEAVALQKMISEADPAAFYIALPAKSIHGEGFSRE